MKKGYIILNSILSYDADEMIVCNNKESNSIITYSWHGTSNKNTLYKAIGKWIVKYKNQ